MSKPMKKIYGIPVPLLILGILAIIKITASGRTSRSILGTRTMQAIDDFKKKLLTVAKAVEAETGIKKEPGIIQASLESNNGMSDLSRPTAVHAIFIQGKVVRNGPANNIFGFKTGDAWINSGKPYVQIPTTDYYKKGQKMPNGEIAVKDNQALKWPAPFRAYDSWDESYRDWARLMQTAGYINDGALDALKKGDLKAVGVALSKRYAPNQNYDQRLAARAEIIGEIA